MKRSADDGFLEENTDVPNEKKTCTEMTQCTPLCLRYCPYRGQHNKWITSLVTLQDSKSLKLDEWKSSILTEAKTVRDLNKPLEDPDPEFCYPLLHWAAILGKVNAFKWLLQQDFISVVVNPKNPMCSQPNESNEMVLFSAVRYLHIGLTTKLADEIYNKLAKLLDTILKHNPMVLLMQDGQTGDTVLHRCARGEKGSTAPFFVYLKRVLGKLEEYYEKEKNPPVSVKKILEKRNGEGDTFLHLLAKSSKREEAIKVIDYTVKEKFPMLFLEQIKNTNGKTADDILKEFKPDPEVFQTSSQENGPSFSPEGPSKGGDEEDESARDLIADQEHAGAGEDFEGEPRGAAYPLATGGKGIEGDQSSRDVPPAKIFQDPASNEMSNPLESLGDASDDGNLFQGSEPEEFSANPVEQVTSHPVTGTSTDPREEAQNAVKKLAKETEKKLNQEKRGLEEITREREACHAKMLRLTKEENEKNDTIKRLEEDLKNYNDFLFKLE